MTDPRFQPADFTVEPAGFGRARTLTWKSDSEVNPSFLEASKIQHSFAVAIRQRAKTQFGSLKSYALAAGTDYQRLTQVLTGRQLMRLEDLAAAQLLLGELVFPPTQPPLSAAHTNADGDAFSAMTNAKDTK